MSSREMSMDTIMEDEDSFVSTTNGIIYAASDISGWTQSLISDNNITNSSSSTSVDDRQQQISTGGGGDDSMIVSSSASSSWFNNNNRQIDDQQEVKIFNVDFRALCNNTCGGSESRGGLLPDTSRIVNEETSVKLVNPLLVFDEAIEENNLTPADVRNNQILRLTIGMMKVATHFADAFDDKIHKLIPQSIVKSSYMSFYESCLFLKFAHFTANQSILEAFADSKRVHVIDFSLNQGLQWPALLQVLTLRPCGPPAFRLSGISGQAKSDDGSDPLQEVDFKLAQFAESIGVEFEFYGFLVYTLADLEASMLNIRPSNEDEGSFVSNTDAIIYAASDISGWTHSLISDNNIPNSSSSVNVDDRQQQISTAGGGGGDSMIVSSGASSSWFNNNNKQIHDHQEIRIFNVDFRALCNDRLKSRGGSEFSSGLLLDTGRTVKEETSVKFINTLMACAEAIQENNLRLADLLISDIKRVRARLDWLKQK